MAIIYEIKNRRVIPNWRDFKRTLPLRELENVQPFKPLDIDITRVINDWKENQSLGVAADLINSVFISGKSSYPEVNEAINFIIKNKEYSSHTLINLANTINNVEEPNKEINQYGLDNKLILKANDINDFPNHLKDIALFKLIHRSKIRTKRELFNPIAWVELSRLYSFFGQETQAEKAMIVALTLAPNNRFVLRSATRLFVHFGKYDKAIFYLRSSATTKVDPWLASAHIATSSLMNRFSPLIKEGIKILSSKNFSNYAITELASTLGTLELSEGSFKKSKEFFNLSLKSPNDNSLAQFEWISNEDSRFEFNPLGFSKVANPFEAFALEKFERGEWQNAFDDCIKWFLDMPYSKTSVLLGSFISINFLKDTSKTILLCEAGLKANPNDPSILNNIVYSLVTSNKLEEAVPYIELLKKIRINSLPKETQIALQATFGLVAINSNEVELGKKLYEMAIQNASNIKNNYLKDLALLNYAKALIVNNIQGKEIIVAKVFDVKPDPKHKEIQAIKDEIIRLYKLFNFNI